MWVDGKNICFSAVHPLSLYHKTTTNTTRVMTKGFIEQTAHDYDMPVVEVERIAKLFPSQFYEKLEEYIANRAKQ